MEKLTYKEIIIGFLVLIVFVISVSVGYLSHKADATEQRVDSLERTINTGSYGD